MPTCRKEYFKQYYLENKPTPEERKWLFEANKEKVTARNKAYREAQRKLRLGRSKEDMDIRKAKKKAQNAAYYQRKKALLNERSIENCI